MSIDPTIAVLYAQTGYTARASHDAATGPQAATAMARVMAEEVAKLEQQQVQRLQSTGESRVAKDDNEEKQSGGMPFGNRRRNRPPPPELENDEPANSAAPLVGNLLNLKV